MIKSFRIVALFEGISYILLLFIAVPVKYLLHDPQYVKLLGLPHGIWFMIYVIMAIVIYSEGKWSQKILYHILLAGIIPFGTFYIDYKYLRHTE
ncbi:MAG: DUF3817 domain-containing protein [Bacteroidia bacterium]|nr:DUF3817 domain-containing protein [Bacteroidia bacterium]MBT8267871.1 DUF3817 domain-containing protein [Bacteroidia bacterium]NNK69684.1 DUF3817 domain-containing protein [Flavobacteriaceae bacterium]NNL79697.1 DUF3817 domain-containing protein [Flavobacteriaceae bacterium]